MHRLSRSALLVCTVPLLAVAASSTGDDAAMARGRAALAHLPLRFEANQGQMPGSIRYAARAGGSALYLTERGASVILDGGQKVDLRLQNSAVGALEPLEPLATRTDYFVGSRRNWKSAVPSYGKVRYRSVYPGVDVVYYGNQNQLEYDFVVAAGADPAAIRLEFSGSSRLSVTTGGDLEVEAGSGRMLQHRPVLYQLTAGGTRREVSGRYRLLDAKTVTVAVGEYDRSRELVIDPVLTYCTYFGGGGVDRITAAKLGPNGRLYLAGWTDTETMPATESPYATESKGSTEIFVAVVDTTDPGYRLLYFSYIGGSNADLPTALALDNAGVLYVTGTTASTDFPVVAAAQTTGAATTLDAFAFKLDTTVAGTDALSFSTYLGGATGDDTPNGIAVDNLGMIYLIGTTKSDDFPVTNNAYQPVKWGPQDAFLAKIDPGAQTVTYASYFGGEDLDEGRAIAIGSDGRAYFVASTLSQTPPWEGNPYSAQPIGAQDLLIAILDTTQAGSASVPYSTIFGGKGNDEVRSMTLDRNGAMIVTGYTLSDDFPITSRAMQNVNNGRGDVFVTIFDPRQSGQAGLLYSTYLGGKGGDVAYSVVGDANGDIYITGYTLSADFPTSSSGVPQSGYPGGTDIFLMKFKPNVPGREAVLYSTYLGATGIYVPTQLTVGSDGTAYIAGYGYVGLPSSDNATQVGYSGGQSDGFLLVIKPDGAPPSQTPEQPPSRLLLPHGAPSRDSEDVSHRLRK